VRAVALEIAQARCHTGKAGRVAAAQPHARPLAPGGRAMRTDRHTEIRDPNRATTECRLITSSVVSREPSCSKEFGAFCGGMNVVCSGMSLVFGGMWVLDIPL